jgi:hypothetical protein
VRGRTLSYCQRVELDTLDTPVYSQAALGFRAWRVLADGLGPANSGRPMWRPGINYAYCPEHSSVNAACQCGLYAFHEQEQAEAVSAALPGLSVIGTLAARGQLQVHHDGFRADEAVITALALPPGVRSKTAQLHAKRMADHYQVPLVSADQLADCGRRFASAVPSLDRPQQGTAHSINRKSLFTDAAITSLIGLLDWVVISAIRHHPWFLWPLIAPVGMLTLSNLFALLYRTPLHNWVARRRRTRWYQCGLSWAAAMAIPTFFLGAIFSTSSTPTPPPASSTITTAFVNRLIASYQTDHRWPLLAAVPGYDTILNTWPQLIDVSQGRCLTLIWNSGSLTDRVICAPDPTTSAR